jgi:hypothetical protein
VRQEGEAAVTVRQLNRRCGPLPDATRARIKTLPLEPIEALAAAQELLGKQTLPLRDTSPSVHQAWLS